MHYNNQSEDVECELVTFGLHVSELLPCMACI